VEAAVVAEAAAAEPTAFEVLDAFDGAFALRRREGTLGGSVPVRVAQACAPLVEGNAFGWQVTATRPLVIERRFGRGASIALDEEARRLVSLHRGALPRLAAHGFVDRDGPFARSLARRPWFSRAGVLWLFTGLLVRARGPLRVSATANRRNVELEVIEAEIGEGLVPLMLGLVPQKGTVRLVGEIATLAPMAAADIVERAIEDEPEAARAHVSFYDPGYFAEKGSGVTRKYRRMLSRRGNMVASGATAVVGAGPGRWHVDAIAQRLVPNGACAVAGRGSIARITFENLVAFRAHFDGHNVTLEHDPAELARLAGQLEARWGAAFGAVFMTTHRRALWYLTKYFTPHPPGEPHFFVKPWAFVRTPPGWSSLLEGIHGRGYDVMRGVVATDRFHATPAVFQLHGPGSIDVPRGTPLLHVYPLPRALLDTGFTRLEWPR
jgi:hypothetical protein